MKKLIMFILLSWVIFSLPAQCIAQGFFGGGGSAECSDCDGYFQAYSTNGDAWAALSTSAKQDTLVAGDVTLSLLNADAKKTREAIAVNEAPELITPTGGWNAALEFDLILTADAAARTLSLQETGPPANGRKVNLYNAGSDSIAIADIDSQQEVIPDGSTMTLGAGEWKTFIYDTDRWTEFNVLSNLAFATITTTETEFIPIAYMIDGTSPPAALSTLSSTNKVNVRAFDGASNEDTKLDWQVPLDIDTTSGIKFSVVCYCGTATAPANTEVIAFSLAGVSVGNSDILSGAVGTAQTSSLTADATYVQYDRLETTFSSAITVTGLAVGETVHFDFIRLAATTDTYAQDIHPAGINIKYKRFHNAAF